MPKFNDEAARQAFHEKMELKKEERRSIWADLVWRFMPKRKDAAMPKASIASLVLKYLEGNGDDLRQEYPFLAAHSDRFLNINYFLDCWPDIKDILIQEGRYVAVLPGKGIYGTHSKIAIEETFALQRRGIQGSIERHNYRAEIANKKKNTEIPTMGVQLALLAPA